MTQVLLLGAISLAGGFGALCRFMCDTVLGRWIRASSVTMAINISGSLVAGALAGMVAFAFPETIAVVCATGFLGGYTTLSTASVQAVQAALDRKWSEAVLSGFVQIVACVAAAAIGFGAVSWVVG